MFKIRGFTIPELNKIVELANFTKREEQLFWLKSKEKTHEECAELMDLSVSSVKRANTDMLDKIRRIIKYL